jgi:two-component system, LytTR family, response regulator
MRVLKAILVDDEINSLQNLQQKLEAFCPEIEIIAAIQQPGRLPALLEKERPDVIFLDIEMPRMNGFKLIASLKKINFEIVFTTAYNHYAIDAIRISAFDYLLKPIVVADLQHCVQRLLKQGDTKAGEKWDALRQGLKETKSQDDKIAIPISNAIDFVQIKEILRIESSSNYSRLVFTKHKPVVVTRLLKDFEEMLTSYGFCRIHNSHLINLSHVTRYIKGDGGQVTLVNGEIIDVARRKKEEFLKLLARHRSS